MNGIVMICYGHSYEKMAAHCVYYSRKYTQVPIHIVTNIPKGERDDKWDSIDNVSFCYLDMPNDSNRAIKTRVIDYTPFNKTLYLDCDSIIQSYGVEKAFDWIDENTLVLNLYGIWGNTSKSNSLYRKAFNIAQMTYPVRVYYGALIGFQKHDKALSFFEKYNKYWKETGCGREMPALCCAAKKSNINIKELSNTDKFFTWLVRNNFIIQHEYGKHVRRLVGCEDFTSYKPFDKRGYNGIAAAVC